MEYGAIAHPEMEGTHRVPMTVGDVTYTVYVKPNITRSFSKTNLPAEIKTKIAFINSVQSPTTFGQTEPTWFSVYKLPDNKDLHDVGWRVNEYIYCLVLSKLSIDSLLGETLTKESV